MIKQKFAVLCAIVFLLTGCGQEQKEPFLPQEEILYGEWQGEDYYILSQSTESGICQIDCYDKNLLPKTTVQAESWGELADYIPQGWMIRDLYENTWFSKQGKIEKSENMGAQVSQTPNGEILAYTLQDKTGFAVLCKGQEKQYQMEFVTDLVCIDDSTVWINRFDKANQNTSVFVNLETGEIISEKKGAYTVERCGNTAVLRPSIVLGTGEESAWLFDPQKQEWTKLDFINSSESSSIRFSCNGNYAVAANAEQAQIVCYKTKDGSEIASFPIEEGYDLYQNSKVHTVSYNGKAVLIEESGIIRRMER